LSALQILCPLSLAIGLTIVGSASPASAQGLSLNPHLGINSDPHTVTTNPGGGGFDCNQITFEGIGDGQVIGEVPGPVTVTFGPSWLGLVDGDDGGSGNFANEPSASTIAFFLTPADPIDFSPAVQFIQVFYVASASSIPVTLTAWDGPNGTGNVVDMTVGNTVGTSGDGANCTGDPTGSFCLWDIMTLTSGSNNIQSITLSGAAADQFGFDDMVFCTSDPIEKYCFGVGCPCGNDDPNAGCANSTGTGASLDATGSPSVGADDLVLTVTNVLPNQFGLVYMGPNENCVPFGDGFRAIDPGPPGGFCRFPVQFSSATGVMTQGPGIVAQSASFSCGPIEAGDVWKFQAYYRDPAGPCGSGFNLSNAVSVGFGL